MSDDRPMLASRQLRLAALAALQAIPSVTVQSPGDWNIPAEKMPVIKLRTGAGHKDGIQRGMPEFNSIIPLEIEAAVEAADEVTALDNIEALGYAIEQAVLLDTVLIRITQKVVSIDTAFEVSSEGNKHLGGLKMSIAFEVFEAFDPTATAPAVSAWPPAAVVPVPLTSMGIHVDLENVFDSTGTYPAPTTPPYAPAAAPRTSGPDGRDEGALDIIIPS